MAWVAGLGNALVFRVHAQFWAAFVDAPGLAVSEPLDPGVKPARFSDYGRIWIT